MKYPTRILVACLLTALAFTPALASVAARNSSSVNGVASTQSIGALERGYRTGYSDGYQSGYGDSVQRAARDYRVKEEYRNADRAYSQSYGALEDYRDGYQQGFETGYNAGYDRRTFDSTIPANLARRGPIETDGGNSSSPSNSSTSGTNGAGSVSPNDITFIPANTVLRVELLTNLSTEATQKGDRFQARVVEPSEYRDALIEGHVSRVKRAGKVKGNSELQLSFDQISYNNHWTSFKAQVIEIIDNGASEGVGDVDEEGGVKGKDKTKDDIAKVGASTGVGAIIGAIFGGGKGAAIGAAIGGAIGTGGVLTSRGKDIRLDHGQQLRIRTANETRF